MTTALSRSLALLTALSAMNACGGPAPSTPAPAPASGPRIVQPGAPGQASRSFSAEELATIEGVSYTPADVRFMQGMIPHHAQALEMTALVRTYATTNAVQQMGLRMEISQRDEIGLMEGWLRDHNEPIAMSGVGAMHLMPGMLTPEQMRNLENARGIDFDRLFLEYMIQHHRGAIDMVNTLFATSGAGQESTIFKFAEDVGADQSMEITRMEGILATLR